MLEVKYERYHGDKSVCKVTGWDQKHNPCLMDWVRAHTCSSYVIENMASEDSKSRLKQELARMGSTPNETGLLRSISASLFLHVARDYCIEKYGFAVPDVNALQMIHDYSDHGVLEIGCGSGYWAMLLKKIGVDVVAYDSYSGKYRSGFKFGEYFPSVHKETHMTALKRENHDRTLFMCWPDYGKQKWEETEALTKRMRELHESGKFNTISEALSKAFDDVRVGKKKFQPEWPSETLMNYRGDTLVYIGEGGGGCTGDDLFHEILGEEWHVEDFYEIPQWYGIHDDLYVYKRGKK